MTDTITSVLEDIISHHVIVGDIALALIAVFVLVLCIKGKIKIAYAYLIDIGLMIVSCAFVANMARITEYAGWYIYDTELYERLMLYNYISFLVLIIIVLMIAIKIFIAIRQRSKKGTI